MIAYLEGRLVEIFPDSCLVLTSGGVGYLVHIPSSVIERLPEPGQEIQLYIQTIVREDAIELYGFRSRQEHEAFKVLVSVSKLGPKTGLAILSTMDPESLAQAIVSEDDLALRRVPGIGPKSAKRMIWELKDKFTIESSLQVELEQGPWGKSSATFSDALAALKNLGYREIEIKPVLNEVLQKDPELVVNELIRAVLKKLSKVSS
jgi:Holliday junction DNA helicase RuvA